MSFCEIKTPPEFSSEIEKWDRDTLADGEKMGNVIEELLNNTVYNNVGISRMNNEIELTLRASGWSASAPYTQTVAVEGLTAGDNPILVKVIADGATPEQVKAYNKAFGMIDDGDTADGQATFKCYNKKPTIDLTVGLKGV